MKIEKTICLPKPVFNGLVLLLKLFLLPVKLISRHQLGIKFHTKAKGMVTKTTQQ